MFYVFFCVQNNVVWLQIFIKHVVIVWGFCFFFVWGGGWQLVLLLGEKKTGERVICRESIYITDQVHGPA